MASIQAAGITTSFTLRMPPDYRQVRLPAVDPKVHEHARDFLQCSLRFRTKRMRPFTFNVQGADHALSRHIHNGNDDFRPSVVQSEQIAWITRNITYVDRLLFSNSTRCEALRDGKCRIRWRSRSAPRNIGYETAVEIDVVDSHPTICSVLSNRLRDLLRFRCAWQILRKDVLQFIESVVFRHKAKYSPDSCPATLLQKLPNQGCAFFQKAAVLRSERFAIVAIDIDFTNDFSIYPDRHDDL